MAAPQVIPPPPGFELEPPVAAAPPPPPGFELEQAGVLPAPPSGFVIEGTTDSPPGPSPAAPGTVPFANPPGSLTAPTLAAAPPVSPFIDALLGRTAAAPSQPPPAASDPTLLPLVSGETAMPPVGPVNAIAPLPVPVAELRDQSKGFANNLSVRELLNAPQRGAAMGVMRYLTGNTYAEQARRRKALGQDRDPLEQEFNAALETVYQAAGPDSPDYQQLDRAFQDYKKVRDTQPDFDWAGVKAAYAADPGGFWAEMAKTVAADPELLATPLGWRTLAGRFGAAAATAGAGARLTTAAKVAGGVVGSAATGAAITAPVSAGVQLGETGTVDPERTARETAIGAGASTAVAGVFVGLGAAVRSLRKLKTRPGVDPAAVDAEIADLLQRTETEAGKAGMTPEAARAEVERFAVDVEPQPEGGSVVRPRTDVLEALPGEAPATHTMPDGTPMPGRTHTDAPDMAAVDNEIGDLMRALPPPERDTPAPVVTSAAKRRASSATEYERLARATEDPVIRQELLRQGELARAASIAARPKLTRAERGREALRLDIETDDVLTALRKLGGLDVRRETAGAGSDFAGRFKGMPRRFGLPAIEQSRGGGHSIETLTERLHDLGYLKNRDADELYDVLDRASRGEEIYSFHADPERAFAKHLPDQDVPTSSDADWTFHAPDEALPDSDFVIDTEAGRVSPARLVSEDDLVRLHNEELANEKWFNQESGSTEQPGRLADAGTARVPERLAGEPEGRPGDQPQPGETGGLPGIEPRNRTRQELADRSEQIETRLRGTRDVPAGEGEGDLFSGRARQTDINDFKLREPTPNEILNRPANTLTAGRGADAVPDAQLDLFLPQRAVQADHVAALKTFGPRVRHVKTGTFPSALTRATTPEQVAHAIAPLRKEAQESLLAIVTDDAGNILRIVRHSVGGRSFAPAEPGIIAGAAANTPGARRVWFAHNHPGGSPTQSQADLTLTTRLHKILSGSGVEPQGMITVAPGGRFTFYHPGETGVRPGADPEFRVEARDESGQVTGKIPGAPRSKVLPVSERRLVNIGNKAGSILNSDDMVNFFRRSAEKEGVLLLDSAHRPVGFLPLTTAEMRVLRGGADAGSRRLLAAIDETNASGIAARVLGSEDATEAVAGNLDGFSRMADVKLLDVIDEKFKSWGTTGRIPEQSTFYSNPFLIGIEAMARDIGVHTGRAVATAGAGGVLGATTSDAEPGSAKWWLDVGAGAVGVTVGAQFLRRTNLLGKGSIVDNWRGRAGTWIDSLPLLGRGPEELRALKAKQRLMQDYLDRQTAEVGKHLLEKFSPSERAMMADLIETRGIVKDLNVIHRQAQALDDYLVTVAQKMKQLGMLPVDLEEGGYLHRYYAKHLGLDKQFREAKGQSLSGSYTIARGTDDVFGRDYLSPGAAKVVDEFEKLRDSAKVLTADKARQRELAKIEFVEYRGLQDGKLRSFLFMRDEVPRVDTGTTPVLAALHKPKPGELDTRTVPQTPGVTDLKPTNYVWTTRGTKGKEVLLHRDWTKFERKSWGEIEDAGYRYTRGMLEASHDLSLATLFDTVRRKGDWVSTTPRATNGKAWDLVPTSGVGKNSPLQKYGALAGKYVRPDIWAGIKGYGRNALRGGPEIPGTGVGVGTAYLAALNKWKLYKTVYNPVTHFNNTYSNVEMLYMGGYSPTSIASGVKHMAQGEQSAVWKAARDAGLFGSDWTTSLLGADGRSNQVLADLAEKLRTQPEIPDAEFVTSLVMDMKQWWINSKNSIDKADSAWKTGAAIAEAMGKPVLAGVGFTLKPVKAAGRAMQRAYQFEDNLFKMAVFAAEIKKGLTPEQAVNEANKLFFDYQDLPEALKLVRDLPIGAPFISYPYFAIQAIARNVAQNPERVLFLVAGYEAINYAALVQQGMPPGEYWKTESAEDATSPPWDRGRALWGARNTVHLPFMDGYRVALGRAHAMGNPFMSEAGGREKLPNMPAGLNVLGSSVFGGNPLHALLDVSVNEDWKGKEIYKPGAPKTEKAAKIGAYLYQAWAPSNIATPGGYQQTKVIEGLANDVRKARAEGKDPGVIAPVVDAANAASEALGFGQFTGLDRAENEIVTRDALLASFGVKLRPIRTEQSVEFETGKLEREKNKAADWFKSKVRENADGRITDAQLATHESDYDAALDRLERGQDKLFDAEQFLQKPKPKR